MLKLRAQILALFAKASHEKSPEAEADLILYHAFRRNHPKIHTWTELKVLAPDASPEVITEALRITEERIKGIPLQHILGEQFFYEHEYAVNDSTLIPRPETEILVQEVILYLEKTYGLKEFRFAELGIGSGIISAEILARFPNATGVASEVSALAITLARQNLAKVVGEDFEKRISILEPAHSEIGFEVFRDEAYFDLIISNPPYVSEKDEIEKEVFDFEPHLALFPVKTGLTENPNFFYENFLNHASSILTPKGAVFMEVPHERALNLLTAFQAKGFQSLRLIPDLTGRYRVLQAEF